MSRRAAVEGVAQINDLAHDGRGVAREQGGKVAFIADALPGETVRWRRLRRRRQVDEGVTLEVTQPSPDRVAPRCRHFGVCGGCVLQHLDPARQIAFKQKQLLDALTRIAGVSPQEVAPPVTGPAWGYRRRARLAVKHVQGKGRVVVGFRERHAPYVADLEGCEVLDPRAARLLVPLARVIDGLSIRDRLPQIELACADHLALVLRVLEAPSRDDLERLETFAREHDLDLYLQPGGIDSVLPLGQVRPLHYSPDGSELRIAFAPTDFIQVNGPVAGQMVRQALDWIGPLDGARVLELFCGLGNFSFPLAGAGARVTALEGDAALVARARENAARLGLEVRFGQADLFRVTGDEPWLAGPYDAILLDPPRSGAREVVGLLDRTGARRMVYVSCHPGTLARDVGVLVNEHGWRLVRAGVLDMFPHTAHVESMALLVRDE